MDMPALEEEAFSAAVKQVAAMLRRPDQLEKLSHYKQRALRKKAAVEAMLKTAVHSQLENVRTGLNQLQLISKDVATIQKCSIQIIKELDEIPALKKKLQILHEENRKHIQCSTAIENLKAIYEIQETVDQTYELINTGKLLHAHQNLMELENARDNVMFEVFKTKSESLYDQKILADYFCELFKLADELSKQLWYIIGRTLEAVRGTDPGPQQLVTSLRIIEREERIDEFCLQRKKDTGFMPVGRPRQWRTKCFDVLTNMVNQRIEGNQLEDRILHKEWLARYLELIRMTVVQDLRVVKSGCTPCFPPEYHIFDRVLFMYHTSISNRLREIAADSLEKNELIQLLSWLRIYSGKDMLGHVALGIDAQKLVADHPLLPRKTVTELLNRFIEITKNDLQDWLGRTLVQEKDDWYKGASPETDCYNQYYTPLASILFQMIDDQIQLGKEMGSETIPNILFVCVEEMLTFTNQYKEAFQAFYNKHFEDRSRFRYFTQTMVSIANVCLICVESSEKLKTNVRLSVQWESPQTSSTQVASPRPQSMRADLLQNIEQLKDRWNLNSQIAVKCLLSEVVTDITPQLALILSSKWLGTLSAVDTICFTIEDYYQDHCHLKASLLNSLLMELQIRVVQEYMKAFEARRLTFQNYEERKAASDQLCKEAERMKELFSRLIKQEDDSSEEFETVTSVLLAVAEVMSLRDKSLLALEVSSFVQKYPNISVEQLSGLIQMREDVGRSEARQLAQEITAQNKLRPKLQGKIANKYIRALYFIFTCIMYNGIGLQSARGSGTSGYVQKNLAHVVVSKDKQQYRNEDDIKRLESKVTRKPNKELILHERKRKIELKCLEMQDLMTEQNYPEEEIQEKVDKYRALLRKKLEEEGDVDDDEEANEKKVKDSHIMAQMMQEKNDRIRRALNIKKDYVSGAAFKFNEKKAEMAEVASLNKNMSLPMCLICEKVFSNEAMKPSRLLEHWRKVHEDKAKKDFHFETFNFQSFKFHARPTLTTMFSSAAQQESDGMKASYNISLLIAKTGKPHTIGEELILPAVSEVLHTVLHKPATDIIKNIPLSNTTLQRRIDEMATDVENTLYNYFRTVQFSLKQDESTLLGNEAVLLAYVRFIKEEKKVKTVIVPLTRQIQNLGRQHLQLAQIRQAFRGEPSKRDGKRRRRESSDRERSSRKGRSQSPRKVSKHQFPRIFQERKQNKKRRSEKNDDDHLSKERRKETKSRYDCKKRRHKSESSGRSSSSSPRARRHHSKHDERNGSRKSKERHRKETKHR
ncbi:Exocyst complex component 3 [Trichinella nativa]|uniref:Exocyst complex component 3 n=1 Tax=Trichinella nativa TaxID=6335 RepID=A0A0V1KXM0_9BILA|nr:Exocyst complex component 3 [Trichinella nativa]